MNKIPLHCIVLLIGPSKCGKSTWANTHFPSHEIIDPNQFRLDLCGDRHNHSMDHIVWSEIHRKTDLKLSLGQRVVIDASNLRYNDRKGFIEVAEKYGTQVFYVIAITIPLDQRKSSSIKNDIVKSNDLFNSSFKEISSGDNGKASIVDLECEIVKHPMNKIPSNLLVIGDVHGNYESLHRAIETAKNKDLFLVSLGDVVDYGGHNLKCIKTIYDLVRNGQASMIIGNHERKLDKWISSGWGANYKGKLSESNRVTIDEILSLNDVRRIKFLAAWNALLSWSSQHLVVNNFLFTHGAATQEMWDNTNRRLYGKDSNFAYFGEVDDENPVHDSGYPNRIWNWVDNVPMNKTVVVGHDWLDRVNCAIVEKKGKNGGVVYAIDTGSSKGGKLSGMIVDVERNSIERISFE